MCQVLPPSLTADSDDSVGSRPAQLHDRTAAEFDEVDSNRAGLNRVGLNRAVLVCPVSQVRLTADSEASVCFYPAPSAALLAADFDPACSASPAWSVALVDDSARASPDWGSPVFQA